MLVGNVWSINIQNARQGVYQIFWRWNHSLTYAMFKPEFSIYKGIPEMNGNPSLALNISPMDHDKLRGGFYTSTAIADWLCGWAIRTAHDSVLEPSCGDGVFLSAAVGRLRKLGVDNRAINRQLAGVELFPTEVEKSRHRLVALMGEVKGIIHCGDFFQWAIENSDNKYHCVVGNPPFIRYQNFPEPSRSRAMSIMRQAGLSPNKLTNIWVPFVVAATNLLLPGGRLALVLPAELLQVSYAAQLRAFLVEQFESIDIVTCNQMIFARALQEVVLFLGDGRKRAKSPDIPCSINLWETENVEKITATDLLSPEIQRERKIVNHDNEKWLKYFLSQSEIALMRELRESSLSLELKHYATVDVGVVTGRNEFFVLNKSDINLHKLNNYTISLIGRACQLKGAIIEREEYLSLAEEGHKVFLFYPRPLFNNGLSFDTKRYIASGEKKGFNLTYKCSIRSPWYIVPSVWNPDFFLFRQIYDFPRVVINRIDATSTDTIHRLNCKIDKNLFLSNFYTHLTAASSEIEGRSYGGGVLELEPTEAERLLMPGTIGTGLDPVEIDQLIRAARLDDVLLENDKRILIGGLGLSSQDCRTLRNIWLKMRNRRQSRKKRGKLN